MIRSRGPLILPPILTLLLCLAPHSHSLAQDGPATTPLGADSWSARRTVEPGLHNGLGYLATKGKYGCVEGNLGKSMGHVTANLYYLDHEMYVAMMSNRSDVPLPLAPFLQRWLGPGE